MGARAHVVTLVAILGAGLALRFINLGHLGLQYDEGTTFLSAEGVLKNGAPILPSGLWYMRAIPLAYLTAPFLWLFGSNEVALRLPGVIAGSATVLLAYYVGRSIFGDRAIGLTAAALIAVHPWAVEMSRYAREYAILQLAYLGLIAVFWKGFVEERRNFRLAYPVLLFITISFSVLGAAALLFPACLALICGVRGLTKRGNAELLIASYGAAALAFIVRSRILVGRSVDSPPSPVESGYEEVLSSLSVLMPAGDLPARFLYLVPIVSIVLSIFVLAVAVAVLVRWRRRLVPVLPLSQRPILLFTFALAAMLGLASITGFTGIRSESRLLFAAFVVAALPFSAIIVQCVRRAIDWIVTMVGGSAMGGGTQSWGRAVVMPIVLAAAVFVVGHPDQSLAIPLREYSDSLPDRSFFGRRVVNGFSPFVAVDFHPDQKTTSTYVDDRLAPGDVVAVAGVPQLSLMYLDQVDYRLWTGRESRAAGFQTDDGIRNRYTGALQLSRTAELEHMIAANRRVWVITTLWTLYPSHVPPDISKWLRDHQRDVVYGSPDGVSKVYLFYEEAN